MPLTGFDFFQPIRDMAVEEADWQDAAIGKALSEAIQAKLSLAAAVGIGWC
jgi:hypothetical protein